MLTVCLMDPAAGEQVGQLILNRPMERTFDRTRLLGTNLALWHEPGDLQDPEIKSRLKALQPAFLRIPGGSWSDEIYWNGNGDRQGNTFDLSRRRGNQWEVDYSAYAPGFRLAGTDGSLSDFHGYVDVKTLHELVQEEGAHAVVTVNAGTGTPEMAAEWVRWANLKEKYGVRYWEIGNELEGAWEMGHFLPDGSKMTGAIYAERFLAFARAMKAVDPTIKIGGPTASNLQAVFLEDFLRIAGSEVDFVSVHTYPVGKGHGDPEAFFSALDQLDAAMECYRNLFRKYQPERADQLEVAITEWNSKVFEDRDTAELLNGLWTAAFVGEMFRHGVSFATQWDLLTRTKEGGHGMFARSGDAWLPASQYWGMHLWSKYMGDQWVDAGMQGAPHLKSYVTRSEDRIHIMVINPSLEASATLQLRSDHIAFKLSGRAVTLSHENYFWDPFSHQPLRSRAPRIEPYVLQNGRLTVPPYCVRVFEFPFKDSLSTADPARQVAAPSAKILLPEDHPADLPMEGWVLVEGARISGEIPVQVSGPVEETVFRVDVREGAGRFFLRPTGPGEIIVRAAGMERSVRIQPVQSREEIVWDFEAPLPDWKMQSDFVLAADNQVRPNQQVASVTLDAVKPDKGRDMILEVTSLPESLPLGRINGLRLDLRVGKGLVSADPDTRVQVVLQSHADHWMVLGSVPLTELEGKWTTLRFPLRDPADTRLVASTYALRLQLMQKKSQKSPVSATLYLDNLGLIFR